MSVVKKHRVFQNKLDKKLLVKVISVIDCANVFKPNTIVVYRNCFIDAGNNDRLSFEFFSKAKWQYLDLAEFATDYELFVADEETLFKIKEGIYE